MTAISDLTRQRVDYVHLPDGRWKAIVTITLRGGHVYRYEATADESDVSPMGQIGEIGGFWHWLKGAAKTVGHDVLKVASVAKKIATSKVFVMAAGALATAIPGVGPIVGPAMMAAAAGMGVASKLINAGLAAEHGLKPKARALTAAAVSDAQRLTKSPEAARALLAHANDKRKAVEKLVGSATAATAAAAKRLPAPASSTRAAKKSHADLLAAARAGKLRSNQAGNVSAAQILAAADKGRVFWVAA